MPKKIAVIDGNSLMHRAYHAVPQTMNAPDGRPTNAVFGFVAMLLKFIDVAHPDAVICAFDAGRPAFRTKALEQYKAQRPPMDDDLKVQFPIIEELLEAMNVPVVRVKGWEGDDVLGTVARRDEQLGYETLLVTGDKDAYQLASDKTRIVTTKKGITDVAIYGPAEVAERYGVTPAQVPDFLGLKGDSSDNIPGVPGIGEKTAAKLLQQYGSLEGLYENLDALKGKQLERIRDNKDAAFASREVATIVCDLDFPLDLEAAAFPSFEEEKVVEAFQKIQFNTHLGRVLKLVGKELEKSQAPLSWEPVVHGDEASALVEAAVRAGETVGVAFVEPEQVSLFSSGVIAAFCTSQGTAAFEEEEGLTVLARVVKSCPFAALDVKETLHRVYPADTAVPALVTDDDLMAMRAFDLGLAGYVLNSSVSEYSFDALLDAYCGGVLPDTKTDEERAVVCAAAARQLVEPLTQALERDGSTRAYFDIDLPLVAVLSIMERTGTALDCDRLAELGASTEDELAGLRERIFDMAGETFNLDSPKQLAHILFEVMGLTPLKKNQRGYSTDAAVLKELSKTHEMPALLLRYRELSKIKSTYIDALPDVYKRQVALVERLAQAGARAPHVVEGEACGGVLEAAGGEMRAVDVVCGHGGLERLVRSADGPGDRARVEGRGVRTPGRASDDDACFQKPGSQVWSHHGRASLYREERVCRWRLPARGGQVAGLVARQTPAGVSPRLIEQVGSGGRDGRKAASCGASAFGQLDQRVDHALVGLAHGREGGARGGQVAVVQNVREGGGGLVQVRERNNESAAITIVTAITFKRLGCRRTFF